jgi:hypothetical protein
MFHQVADEGSSGARWGIPSSTVPGCVSAVEANSVEALEVTVGNLGIVREHADSERDSGVVIRRKPRLIVRVAVLGQVVVQRHKLGSTIGDGSHTDQKASQLLLDEGDTFLEGLQAYGDETVAVDVDGDETTAARGGDVHVKPCFLSIRTGRRITLLSVENWIIIL